MNREEKVQFVDRKFVFGILLAEKRKESMNPVIPVEKLDSDKLVELVGVGVTRGQIGPYQSRELLGEVKRRLKERGDLTFVERVSFGEQIVRQALG